MKKVVEYHIRYKDDDGHWQRPAWGVYIYEKNAIQAALALPYRSIDIFKVASKIVWSKG